MFGFGPLSGTPISALPNIGLGPIEVIAEAIIEARLHNPLADLVGDPKVRLVLAVEIDADETLYAATHPFITRAADTPANQPFAGTLEGALVVDRSITGAASGYGGYVSSVAEFAVINADGEYDAVADADNIAGRDVVFRLGNVTGRDIVGPYAEFEVLAQLIAERWRVTRDKLTVDLRDQMATLDVPVQTQVYAGVGELNGGEDLKGLRRPFGDGQVRGATPSLVIAAELLWQCNGAAVDEIVAVYDGGVALDFVADHATVALLRAATLIASQWASCNAQGYFRTGGAAFKQVTCDFNGLRETTADIIQNIALTSAGLAATDLDAWTFEHLNDTQPAIVAYYLDKESTETCAEMFTKLMAGIGGWHGMTTLGKLQVRRFVPPVEIAADYYNTDGGNLLEIDLADLPADFQNPPHRRRVAFARNFTIQSDVFGAVSETDPARAEALKQPYQLAITSDAASAAILADFPQAPDPPPIEGYFVNEADALTEAERLLDLPLSGYKAYRFTAAHALFMRQIGQVVNVTDSRLGLSAGKYLTLVSARDDTRAGTTEMIGVG